MVETIELEIDDSMRAMRFDVESRTLALRTVPVPEIGHDEVLVRVEAAGVCLSDVHIAQGLIKPRHIRTGEVTLGHEVAGTVARIGEGVAGWTVGDRIALQPLVLRSDGPRTLGVDYDGGWAEYVVTPASTLVAIPTGLAFEEAAIIPDAVSTPWSAIRTTGQVRAGESVGVWGVGGLGAHAIQLLRLVGAAPIVAVDPLLVARDRALALGADAALDPTAADFLAQLKDATRGRMLDLALDFAGVSAAQQQTLSSLAYGGRIVLVGLSGRPITIENSVDFSVFKHTVRGHFGQDYSDVPELIDLVSWGRLHLSGSISGVLPLEEAADAIRRLDEKIDDPIRLILRP
ncbi:MULTISPECIES: zinc-binding dehydrogenase [Rhodococcus]|uniref:zinc-binding dehydrogenase n=1 Tax=Rhodococcus TaxID=1827 RepID=UPI00071E044B|nr:MULTISPECIES: zinc-binding dehydrogenase [Rhodococcus]ANQ75910.1 zinc-binding dehydrogenase [Rhodococcus sp. 008]KSU69341.1 zinc-binding dehydrogenase [Rhodococcus qingshengii]SCC66980.1 D-arabinose 1-dehydrogenase, Zn-dependent alcohol dehydrogenase family [Rhodococcus qingshengii]